MDIKQRAKLGPYLKIPMSKTFQHDDHHKQLNHAS